MKHKKMIRDNKTLTKFQKKVLTAILDIPRGETRSYAWVANKIGTRAYRAVGNALNKNPYAPHVPCHRVISSNGAIGGYAKGVEVKRVLLKKEGITV